jgi:hypothetical protein
MKMTKPRSGRTFRKLLSALVLASNGEDVIYVSYTAKAPHINAKRVCDTYFCGYANDILFTDNSIRFPNGRVVFVSKEFFEPKSVRDEILIYDLD